LAMTEARASLQGDAGRSHVNDGPERQLMLVLSMLTMWAGLILVEIVCVADVGTLATTRRLLKL
jgi:hypothetical protein